MQHGQSQQSHHPYQHGQPSQQATQAQQVPLVSPSAVGMMTSPGSIQPAFHPSGLTARRPYLYVGQLSPQVNETDLKEVFGRLGAVLSAKVVSDRSMQYPGAYNYGFVEFTDLRSAEAALKTLNGTTLYDSEIRVDWAANSVNQFFDEYGNLVVKENTASHAHVFVGDLAPEITDAALRQAFASFSTLSEARVMWDMASGKSRGYGFVAFRDKADAEKAIATMNGEWLGSRAIRVNWANQKGAGGGNLGLQHSLVHQQIPGQPFMTPNRAAPMLAALSGMANLGLGTSSMPPTAGSASGTPITYEQALASSAPHNTTVYVGNIPPFATQSDLVPLFSQYGYIIEIRMQADRGFAFVKLDTHENAASAIVHLAGSIACGRPIKCGWGKDRNESAMLNALRQGMQLSGYAGIAGPPPQSVYGMPQYAFPAGFTAFPAGAAATGLGQSNPIAIPMDAATLQQAQAAQLQVQPHVQSMQQQQHTQQQIQSPSSNISTLHQSGLPGYPPS